MALTIKLTPGYDWPAGDVVTLDKLRLAANPTIELEGGISAATIGDNSIQTAKLVVGILSADSAGRSRMAPGYLVLSQIAAGIFTADNLGRAPFAAGFINEALLAANSVGTAELIDANVTLAKLSAGIIASAPVKAAPTTSDLVPIADAAASNATKYCTLLALKTLINANTAFISAQVAIGTSSGILAPVAHNLGATPTNVNAYAICTTAHAAAGYAVGDIINLGGIQGGSLGASFSWGANATLCWITEYHSATFLNIFNKTTGATVSLTGTTAGYWKAFLVASA